MKIIIGLGNPGRDYTNTRHNAGFLAIDALHNRLGFPKFVHEAKLKADISGSIMDGNVTLRAKPQTFMNKSGELFLVPGLRY